MYTYGRKRPLTCEQAYLLLHIFCTAYTGKSKIISVKNEHPFWIEPEPLVVHSDAYLTRHICGIACKIETFTIFFCHALLIDPKSKGNWCNNKSEIKYSSINTCQVSPVRKASEWIIRGPRFNPHWG